MPRSALAGFLAWAAVSLLWSPDPYGGFNEVAHFTVLTGAFVLGGNLVDVSPVMRGLSLGLTVSAVVCALRWLGVDLVTQNAASDIPAGLFFNSNMLAELAAPVLVWGIVARAKVGWLLGPAACFAFALDRAAALSSIAALAIFKVPRWFWLFWPFLFPVLLLVFLIMTEVGPDRLWSLDERLSIWSSALSGLTVFGRGAGSFMALFQAEYAHNDLLQALFEFGVAALIPAAVLVYSLLRPQNDSAARSAYLLLLLEGLVSFPLQLPASGVLTMLLAGSLCASGGDLRGRKPGGGGENSRGDRWPASFSRIFGFRDWPGRADFPV